MRQECFDWKDDSDYKEKRSPRNRSCMLIWYGVSYIHNQALDPILTDLWLTVRSREIFLTSILFHLRLWCFDLSHDDYFEPSSSYSQSFGRFLSYIWKKTDFSASLQHVRTPQETPWNQNLMVRSLFGDSWRKSSNNGLITRLNAHAYSTPIGLHHLMLSQLHTHVSSPSYSPRHLFSLIIHLTHSFFTTPPSLSHTHLLHTY